MNRYLLVVLLLITGLEKLNAQNVNGIYQGNKASVQGMFHNPATIADNDYLLGFNLATVNASVDNNIFRFSFDSLQSSSNSFQNFTAQNQKAKLIAPYLEVQAPSFYVKFLGKYAIGFSSRLRVLNRIENLDPRLVSSFQNATQGVAYNFDDNEGFSWNTQSISDYGIVGAAEVIDNGLFKLSAGASLRIYRGLSFLSIQNRGLQGKLVDGPTDTSSDYIQVSKADLSIYGRVADVDGLGNEPLNFGSVVNNFFGSKAVGKGFGIDVGGTLLLKQPIADRNAPYWMRIGIAATDIGSITYKNATTGSVKGAGTVYLNELEDYGANADSALWYLQKQGLTITNDTQDVKSSLPGLIALNVDYCFTKKFYLNLAYQHSLVPNTKVGMSYPNRITLSPRAELGPLTIALPLSYNNVSNSLKAGLGIRIGPLTLGSDDLGIAFSKSKGGNFYFGLGFSIKNKTAKRKQKQEGDKVETNL